MVPTCSEPRAGLSPSHPPLALQERAERFHLSVKVAPGSTSVLLALNPAEIEPDPDAPWALPPPLELPEHPLSSSAARAMVDFMKFAIKNRGLCGVF